jgi:acetyltransferase-like isoleucine patch superfamily enzyme
MLVSALTTRSSLFTTRLLKIKPLGGGWRTEIAGDLDVQGQIWVPGPGRLRIGRGVRLIGRRAPIELRAYEGAEIVIEDGVVIEDGTSIEATRSVRIGARARIGAFCKIIDNHFHNAVGDRFVRPEPEPVVIGAGAVVGPRAVVLPGGELGEGATLGAGCVLSFRLAAGTDLAK